MYRALLVLSLVAFVAIVLAHAGYVPIWDSAIYANCLFNAVSHPYSFDAYSCAGHTSHAYLFLLTIPAQFSTPSVWQFLLVNALLGVGAILSVFDICRSLFPERRYRWEAALLAGIVAMNPSLLSSAVFFNVDYGVCIFGLATMASLLRRRYWLVALAASMLVFSKETGLVVYLILVVCYLLTGVGRTAGDMRSKLKQALRLLPLGLPLLLIVVYALHSSTQPSTWRNPSTWPQLAQSADLRLFEAHSRATLAGIFVLQFAWITTVVVLLGVLRSFYLFIAQHPSSQPTGTTKRASTYIICATTVVVLVLSRAPTNVNTRYFTLVYPLLAIVFLMTLIRHTSCTGLRRSLLSVVICLSASSAFRTIDPVSKRLYGTFAFGEHAMLNMTAISRECCGYGVDQLAYNLEFANIARLLDAAIMLYEPTRERPIVVSTGAAWKLFERMDPISHRRTIRHAGAIPIPAYDLGGFVQQVPKPRVVYFLALPNIDNRSSLAKLNERYDLAQTARFEVNGYSMLGYRLVQR